jgi:hypothetical protein
MSHIHFSFNTTRLTSQLDASTTSSNKTNKIEYSAVKVELASELVFYGRCEYDKANICIYVAL